MVALTAWACSTQITRGVDEQQAEQWINKLEQAGIVASGERDDRGLFAVRIATRDTAAAVRSLINAHWECPKPPAASPLLPSLADERSGRAQQIALELERDLGALQGVVSAKLHVSLAEPAPWTESGRSTPPTASVLLEHSGATPPVAAGQIAALVAGAVPGLQPEAVQVILKALVEPGPAPPLLERIGPVTLTRSSAHVARAALIVGAGLVVASAAAMLLLWWRLRKVSSQLARLPVGVPPQSNEAPHDAV